MRAGIHSKRLDFELGMAKATQLTERRLLFGLLTMHGQIEYEFIHDLHSGNFEVDTSK